jgi:hypothetical protein
MNSGLRIRLHSTPEQAVRVRALQQAFAEACNALAPIARDTGCWNRVALHHQTYRELRARFPALGSQMVCNAIYSVSRACRQVYQHPASPFNLQRRRGLGLPLIRFAADSPVYFDRHTLSIASGMASMFTLDGRMRFNLPLAPTDEERFRRSKLREVVLSTSQNEFFLDFQFAAADEAAGSVPATSAADHSGELPEYLVVIDDRLDPARLAAIPHTGPLVRPAADAARP